MNKLCYSTELIIRVAKLYYMDNLTQESVARKLNIKPSGELEKIRATFNI